MSNASTRRRAASPYSTRRARRRADDDPRGAEPLGGARHHPPPARRALEGEVVRKATLNANPAQRREVSRLCDVVLADVNGGRPWRKSDHAFHGAIYEASGNPMFGQI
ncbi:MAG: FadR family transcriptional regulator, partial [Rhizobiales bacterium]|nr:FadR family transcriptional regulator [Hyphomicrobiales bacterium]